MAIPVIDMANFNGEGRADLMLQIAHACETPGFFQLLNHGIKHSLLDRVKKVCRENYTLNREENFKESLPVRTLNNLIHSEFEGSNRSECNKIGDIDWEDIFLISDLKKTDSWPSQPNDFRETVEEFQQEIFKLAERLLEIINQNLGLEKDYLKKVFAGTENPFFGTKVSHYPPCPRPDLVQGLRAHTDAGGLILLFQDDEVSGLQVLNNGQWIDVQPTPYSIVIDIGDQLEVISGGRYKSAWHRILPTKNGNRLSVASYYNPSFNAVVHPADKHDSMWMYPKYSFGDYMNVYEQLKFDAKEPRFQAMRGLSSEQT